MHRQQHPPRHRIPAHRFPRQLPQCLHFHIAPRTPRFPGLDQPVQLRFDATADSSPSRHLRHVAISATPAKLLPRQPHSPRAPHRSQASPAAAPPSASRAAPPEPAALISAAPAAAATAQTRLFPVPNGPTSPLRPSMPLKTRPVVRRILAVSNL